MRIPRCLGLAWATGCGCDLEVTGGTDEERATAWAVIDAFRARSLPFDVCRVELTGEMTVRGDGASGSYNTLSHGIRVDTDPPDHASIELVLTHELCHAVDRQNNVRRKASEPWAIDPGDADELGGRAETEAFALWCELGVDSLALADHPDAIRVLEAAFPGTKLPRVAIERELEMVWPVPDGWTVGWDEIDAAGDGVASLTLVSTDLLHQLEVSLDLRTCTEADATFVAAPSGPDVPATWRQLGGYGPLADGMLTAALLRMPDGSVEPAWLFEMDGQWHRALDERDVPRAHGVVAATDGTYGVEADLEEVRCWRWEDAVLPY